MATITAAVKSYRLQSTTFGRIITVTFDSKFPAIDEDGADVETSELRFTLRQLIAQLTNVRPEAADLLERVNLASKSSNPTLMQAFLKVILTDASYEIDSIRYEKDDVFEDGTVAQSAGYRRDITGITFAPAVEAKIKPISLDDALSALGF